LDELEAWAEGLESQLRVVGDADAVQDGFVRAMRCRGPAKVLNPQGYWYRASLSALRDRHRRQATEERAIRQWLEIKPREGDRDRWSEEQLSALRGAIEELDGRRRQLIELELSGVRRSRDVAKVLELSEGATRVLRHRTYRQLRAAVERVETAGPSQPATQGSLQKCHV
jgi:RNA polymerase sigma factor (sigma-70 family)